MATRTARTLAQDKWRKRTALKKIELYLLPEVADALDAAVKNSGHRGRAALLTQLITQHTRVQVPASTSTEPAIDMVDRVRDPARCEGQTATGRRCRLKCELIIRVPLSDTQAAEFSACRRHGKRAGLFVPFPTLRPTSSA